MFIRTRYHGPTDTRGSRVSATTVTGKRVYVPWDHALSIDDNHNAAARKAADLIAWSAPRVWRGTWVASGERCYMPFGIVFGESTEYFSADFTDTGNAAETV